MAERDTRRTRALAQNDDSAGGRRADLVAKAAGPDGPNRGGPEGSEGHGPGGHQGRRHSPGRRAGRAGPSLEGQERAHQLVPEHPPRTGPRPGQSQPRDVRCRPSLDDPSPSVLDPAMVCVSSARLCTNECGWAWPAFWTQLPAGDTRRTEVAEAYRPGHNVGAIGVSPVAQSEIEEFAEKSRFARLVGVDALPLNVTAAMLRVADRSKPAGRGGWRTLSLICFPRAGGSISF